MRTKIKFIQRLLVWLNNIKFHKVYEVVSELELAAGRKLYPHYALTSFKERVIVTLKFSSQDMEVWHILIGLCDAS